MVFIMLALLKPHNWLKIIYFILVCCSLSTPPAHAQLTIHSANVQLEENVYTLNSAIEYQFSQEVVEALHSGVALTFALTITIERERWYLWDETVANLKQRYQIKHFALGNRYQLTYLNTGIKESYPTLKLLLQSLGKIEHFPLLDKHLVKPDGKYWVNLQVNLDIEALPAPLRPLAYFSSEWRLTSGWHLCALRPQN
jgi:hypothetical protein